MSSVLPTHNPSSGKKSSRLLRKSKYVTVFRATEDASFTAAKSAARTIRFQRQLVRLSCALLPVAELQSTRCINWKTDGDSLRPVSGNVRFVDSRVSASDNNGPDLPSRLSSNNLTCNPEQSFIVIGADLDLLIPWFVIQTPVQLL